MKLSAKGATALAVCEGVVLRTYRCSAGILTIGIGFTNRSVAFKKHWIKTRGRKLMPGDTITKKEALELLPIVCAEEYGLAVNRKLERKRITQHAFDGAVSMTYNCGRGALNWKWFKLGILPKDYSKAARLLRVTGITANGKKIRGLIIRREHEAEMIEHGVYRVGEHLSANPPVKGKQPNKPNERVKQYQKALVSLGYICEADGWLGPNTSAAIKQFQTQYNFKNKEHPSEHLTVDGRFGPATYGAINRTLKIINSPISIIERMK